MRSSMTVKHSLINYMQQYSYHTDADTDDFGIENMPEGYDDYQMEDLHRFTHYKAFVKDNMDLYYEQDLTNYPDIFKVYQENFDKYDQLNKEFEHEEAPRDNAGFYKSYGNSPGAMRAWLNKWDPDFNTEFRQKGTQIENNNNI